MVTSRHIRFALALLVITASIGILVAIYYKGSRSALPEPVSKQLPQNIDVALRNARFSEMQGGATVWELVADRAEYDKAGDVVYLSNINMVFEKSRSNGKITVTANKGEYVNSSKNVRLRGKVHVVTESGMVFDTESLDYQAEPSMFRTVDSVKYHRDRLSLSAVGMEMDVKAESSRFFKSIDAVVEGVSTR
jgi:LPS export ABC transporter protein LptC